MVSVEAAVRAGEEEGEVEGQEQACQWENGGEGRDCRICLLPDHEAAAVDDGERFIWSMVSPSVWFN
ncbi:hypothetical protein VCV18_004165 [Metarhizium anisopliae]